MGLDDCIRERSGVGECDGSHHMALEVRINSALHNTLHVDSHMTHQLNQVTLSPPICTH